MSIDFKKLEKGLDATANQIYKTIKPTLLAVLAGLAANLEVKAAKWLVKKLPAETTPETGSTDDAGKTI